MLGFIILIGTVVNNPILIVEQALNQIRDEDMPHREAVVESVRTRIRPIFMTTLIGFFGLLPLVISPGAGSELYRGLGSVLLGGLMVSTVFTLFLVPSLFSLALEVRDWVASQVPILRPTESHDGHPRGERHTQLRQWKSRRTKTKIGHSGFVISNSREAASRSKSAMKSWLRGRPCGCWSTSAACRRAKRPAARRRAG